MVTSVTYLGHCHTGNLPIAQVLLKKGMKVNLLYDGGMTPLMIASEAGHRHIVDYLLSQSANVYATISQGLTAFMLACEQGKLEVLPSLYNMDKRSINMADVEGWTPLMYACAGGNTALVAWLLDHQADMKPINNEDMSAYDKACSGGQVESIKVLVEKCKGIQQIDNHTKGLFLAAESGHLETIRYLLSVGISVNSADDTGMTALMYACKEARLEVVMLLIENGADIHMTTRVTGCNALLSVSDVLFQHRSLNLLRCMRMKAKMRKG